VGKERIGIEVALLITVTAHDYGLPMKPVQCPVCGAASDGGYSIGDDILFICPKCEGYRLARTAITLLENGTLQKPDPKRFRDLVSRKRGTSTEYPVITSGDLGA
jgi:hypothetical protein